MAKSSEVLPGPDSDARVREVKGWLKSKGVRDFEPVSLFCDQLTKVCLAASVCRFSGSDIDLGHRRRNRKACRQFHSQQIIVGYQESHRERNPETGGPQACSCYLSPSKSTFCSWRSSDDGAGLWGCPSFSKGCCDRFER